MQQEKQRAISKIIEQKYIQSQEFLNLFNQKQYWANILLIKDWSMLKTLSLTWCDITNHSISVFFKLYWPHLGYLDLCSNKFTNQGMKQIGNCFMKNLKQIWLNNNFIGNLGIKHLVKSDLPNLETIHILNCRIQSEGIKHMTKANWPHLRLFLLGSDFSQKQNKILLNGWEIIHQNNFPKLKYLYVNQKSAICWLNCVLIQTASFIQINDIGIEISNYGLQYPIKQILYNRDFTLFNDD